MNGLESGVPVEPVAALFFQKGERPSFEVLQRWANHRDRETEVFVLRPDATSSLYVELLRKGLTFDLTGLADCTGPGPQLLQPYSAARFCTERAYEFHHEAHEVLNLWLGPHLSAGDVQIKPVAQGAAALVADLTRLPGLVAVSWVPARSLVAPTVFERKVRSWLAGGAFPLFALASLDPCADKSILSRGLRSLIGRELRLQSLHGIDEPTQLKHAVRVIDWLALQGQVASPCVARLPGVGPVQFEFAPHNELLATCLPD